MRTHHPSVKLTIQVFSRDAIVAAVLAGDADLGLGYFLPADPKLRVLARAGLRVGAVVAPGHPLAGRGGVSVAGVSLGDCAGYPMIIPDRGVTLGALVADALERGGIAVDTVIETNAIELLKAAVAAGHAVTFLNELDVRPERRAGSLVFLKLPDGQMARQELRLIQSARGGLDAAPSLLAEHLREAVAGLND
jgi:DNA-binding transcriptional LysR family regulator